MTPNLTTALLCFSSELTIFAQSCPKNSKTPLCTHNIECSNEVECSKEVIHPVKVSTFLLINALMSRIECKYCLISTSYLAGFHVFHIFILFHI